MALTETYLPYSRHKFFQFFASGSATSMDESLDLGVPFELCDIRIHLSVVHASAEYFRAYLSAVQGSAFNFKFVSQIMNALTDYVYQPSTPMVFAADDQIRLSMTLSSANVWGITISGWAITG